jgi:phenylacetate-CoA ligase
MPLPLPRSRAEVVELQRARKRVAVERARQAPLFAERLARVDPDKLDDPAEWRKIPLLTKEELRKLSTEEFYTRFCIQPRSAAVEFWRSGGATGKPLFYPRSTEDMRYNLLGFQRIWECIGAGPGDTVHDAFPLGIHPVGQLIPRSAALEGIGSLWAGAGTTTPSLLQLELIQSLRPTIVAGMSSYVLHLANVAEASGIDLRAMTVRRVFCSAEQLTAAKRGKIERAWGARVYDGFGMTEGSMMAVERDGVDGLCAWSDLFYMEVIDETTGEPVAEGEVGALVMTPLWSNTVTPFLRWLSGDIVSLSWPPVTADPWSVFPVLRHAHRTAGFFKIRGVNINHTELEDFMFNRPAILDFKAELLTEDDREVLRLSIEVVREADPARTTEALVADTRRTFEVTPAVEVLPLGTLARDFEKAVKTPRFVDRRT